MYQRLQIKIRDRWYNVDVEDLHSGTGIVFVDGEPVEVHIENPSVATQDIQNVDSSRTVLPTVDEVRSARAIKTFNSPMPGTVVSVIVDVGDQLVTGDEVCVLESMKMQQTLRADWSGIVKTVHVQSGQQVIGGDPLIELE